MKKGITSTAVIISASLEILFGFLNYPHSICYPLTIEIRIKTKPKIYSRLSMTSSWKSNVKRLQSAQTVTSISVSFNLLPNASHVLHSIKWKIICILQHVTVLLPFLVFAETNLRQSERLNLANTYEGFFEI
jgi:hypothetical protein